MENRKIELIRKEYMTEEVLDFSDLSAEDTRLLNGIAEKMRYSYSEWVDDFTRNHSDFKYIWAIPLVSREISNDSLFMDLCVLELARNILKTRSIKLIIVDSEYQAKAIRQVLNQEVVVIFKRRTSAKSGWQSFIDTKLFIRRERMISKVKTISKNYSEPFSLVITPTLSSQFNGNIYIDRYFTGLTDYSDEVVGFFPSLIENTNIDAREFALKPLECMNYDFLCGYLYLQKSDYNEIKIYQQYCKNLVREEYMFNEMDISILVKESLLRGITNVPAFKGILFYQILKCLREKNAKIKNFIIWYEGRPSDLMCAAAIREIYPEAGCVAYEGKAFDAMELSLHISKYQYESGKAPKKVAIPGEAFASASRQFCKDVDLIYVPVLRDEYVLKKSSVGDGDTKRVLVVLTGDLRVNRIILEWLRDYVDESGKKVEIHIKNHPIYGEYTLGDYGVEEFKCVAKFVDGKLEDHFDGKSLVITSSTSSTMQILYNGLPVIILCASGDLKCPRLPSEGLEDLYRVVYDRKEYFDAIELFLDGYTFDNSVLDGMMTEKNRENVARLFQS